MIAHLAIALLADKLSKRPPRVLVVVPSRALLAQHAVDASWLRALGIAVNELNSGLPPLMYMRLLQSFGVLITTPIALRNRTSLLGQQALLGLDCVMFDEIDTYLTVDDLDRREDIGPALTMCMDQNVPIIGFTGTHLTGAQVQTWTKGGFSTVEPKVDSRWMPFTQTTFEPISDRMVAFVDGIYSAAIGRYYAMLEERYGALGFREIKKLARDGDDLASNLLREMSGRLRLFESAGTNQSKYRRVATVAQGRGPTLILTRYVRSAEAVAAVLTRVGVDNKIVHGAMSRLDIEAGTKWFRGQAEGETCALVLTRDLGGRGLDFARAARVVLISPRSNHQTVAQELARIRSRTADPKQAVIFYYARTEEEAKAQRLATALRRDRYGDQPLFEVSFSRSETQLTPFESKNLRNEESLPYRAAAPSG